MDQYANMAGLWIGGEDMPQEQNAVKLHGELKDKYGMPIPDVDRVAKLIPETLNIEIADALKEEPELQKLYDTDPQVRQLLDNAIQLEGHTRHAGVHAAGVIVATRPLQEIVPLYKQPGSADNEIITQWDGPTCEKMGLLKMDFLGLRTLSIIERARTLIKETLSEEEIWQAVGRKVGDGSHPLDLDRPNSAEPKVFTPDSYTHPTLPPSDIV